MLVIRNVFRCKPGQAKKLVGMFKEMSANNADTIGPTRVLTDVSGHFWTVVFETEAESLGAWEKTFESMNTSGARKPMEGYMDLVEGGHREIFRVE
jgi:hypothetical protein